MSACEQDAQWKVYHMYLNSLNTQPEHCGCGTAVEIAYMGHNTEYVEFQYIHERESYEVLLAILKRKKVTFSGCSNNQPRLHSPKVNEDAKEATEEEVSVGAESPTSKGNSTQSVTETYSCSYTKCYIYPAK